MTYFKNKILLILSIILLPNILYGDFSFQEFGYSDWFRPFWSDMHSTITSTEFAWANNTKEYGFSIEPNNIDSYSKIFSFSNIGWDIPLATCNFGNGKFGLGLTLPLLVDVWVDYFETTTSPVINASYRMGMPELVFIHRLDEPLWIIRNYAIKLTPFKHESTHLGDELTIYRKDANLPLTRVNVSYNYFECGLTINDPDGTTASNHSLRFSFMRLLDPKKGWYNVLPFEGDTSLVKYPTSNNEFYIQYQYQTATDKKFHLQYIISAERRYRVKYDYPFLYGNLSTFEKGYWKILEDIFSYLNLNIAAGIRYNNPAVLKDYKIGLSAKYYNGINPYGQFRAIPFFSKIGIALLFER
jgi:hypothetical protein